ncbi:MAG: 6,7-dimethyl-8-ribityllumazine synthase [Candidatus Dormibacteria bacterium]|jgi:6,7-dimethyl-8-ribityllumazine synthase
MKVGDGDADGRRVDATGLRIAIVVARFNEAVSRRLLSGAMGALTGHGAAEADIAVHWVPGSLEIPFAAQEVARSGAADAIVCLGAVIRGETTHYDLVAGGVAQGVTRVSLEHRVACGFGVLTTESLEQAMERSGGKHGNKGADAALAAVEAALLAREIRSLPAGGRGAPRAPAG